MARKKKTMGTIERIIILHGWTYSIDGTDPLDKWKPLINELILKGFKVSLPRVPGITKNINQVWSLEKYIDWLKKIVDEEKGKVTLIGHSNGGRIGFSFSEKYPEIVSHLILIDSAGIYHNKLPTRIKRFVFKYIAKIGKMFISSEKMKTLLYKLAREGDYKNATPKQRQTMLNLIKTDLTPIISQIKTPTLIIWGEEDKVTPLSDGKLMKSLINNSKLEIIKSARHSPMFTHPKQVAESIIEEIK